MARWYQAQTLSCELIMKSKHSDLTQRYMILLKIDSKNLSDRVKTRHSEYIEAFTLKRDRSIFKEVFFSRYGKATIFDLSHLPVEVIEVANDFYQEADKLYWYLLNTQDMPNTIEDEVIRYAHSLEMKFNTLELFIDAELSGRPAITDEEMQIFSDENFV